MHVVNGRCSVSPSPNRPNNLQLFFAGILTASLLCIFYFILGRPVSTEAGAPGVCGQPGVGCSIGRGRPARAAGALFCSARGPTGASSSECQARQAEPAVCSQRGLCCCERYARCQRVHTVVTCAPHRKYRPGKPSRGGWHFTAAAAATPRRTSLQGTSCCSRAPSRCSHRFLNDRCRFEGMHPFLHLAGGGGMEAGPPLKALPPQAGTLLQPLAQSLFCLLLLTSLTRLWLGAQLRAARADGAARPAVARHPPAARRPLLLRVQASVRRAQLAVRPCLALAPAAAHAQAAPASLAAASPLGFPLQVAACLLASAMHLLTAFGPHHGVIPLPTAPSEAAASSLAVAALFTAGGLLYGPAPVLPTAVGGLPPLQPRTAAHRQLSGAQGLAPPPPRPPALHRPACLPTCPPTRLPVALVPCAANLPCAHASLAPLPTLQAWLPCAGASLVPALPHAALRSHPPAVPVPAGCKGHARHPASCQGECVLLCGGGAAAAAAAAAGAAAALLLHGQACHSGVCQSASPRTSSMHAGVMAKGGEGAPSEPGRQALPCR